MYTINQIEEYLVDCMGYSQSQDLEGLKKSELLDLVDDKFSLNLFTNQ